MIGIRGREEDHLPGSLVGTYELVAEKKRDGVGKEGCRRSAWSPGMGRRVLNDPALSRPSYIRPEFRPWECPD